MSDKFVVSTNEIGEIIVTDVETSNVYHYGSMSNFLGLIRLLNEQEATINKLQDTIYDELDKALELLGEIYEDYPKNNVHRLCDNLKGLKEMIR